MIATKQPTITSATNLTVNKLITRNIEPPVGFTDISLNADTVYFGNTVWLTATSTIVKFWIPCYFDQGIKANRGFMIGYDASTHDHTLIIDQNGNITTQGTITCVGNLSAPNIYIYTKMEADNKLTLKLDSSAFTDYNNKSYVDNALAGKTTYDKYVSFA